jgi:hypothetical protein
MSTVEQLRWMSSHYDPSELTQLSLRIPKPPIVHSSKRWRMHSPTTTLPLLHMASYKSQGAN